jgi:Complex I intermediate-associated protein 30 (CIA30).
MCKPSCSLLSLLWLSLLFSTIFNTPDHCHAFSNSNTSNNAPTAAESRSGGWKTRPLIPELAKTPDAPTQDKANVKNPNSSANLDKIPKRREKWDFFRFLSQSSKFVTLPKPPLMPQKTVKVLPGDILWQSSENAKTKQETTSSSTMAAMPRFTFAPLDDVVMGGVSSSSFSPLDGTWKGTVSDSNSGGFVGIRSTPFSSAIDMSQCEGVELTLGGSRDKIFKAVIRDSTDFNGICWTTTFGGNGENRNTKGKNIGRDWMKMIAKQTNSGQGVGVGGVLGKAENEQGVYKVKILFDDLISTIFARTVPGQKLNSSTIQGFQIAYSKFLFDGDLNPKFELGDFQLDLLEVKAC